MTFSEDTLNGQIETINPKWEYIESSLKTLDPVVKAYFILTDELASYIQCAGEKEKLTVEFRKFSEESFKHYVVGRKRPGNSTNIIWTQIDCKVGPIHIQENEVLTILDAISIFKAFYDRKDLPTLYNKRNTTKQFEK